MPIPAMTETGLLPAGVHVCSMSEAENFCCWNPHRAELWRNLLEVLRELRTLGVCCPLILDGMPADSARRE